VALLGFCLRVLVVVGWLLGLSEQGYGAPEIKGGGDEMEVGLIGG
jgi:hypothetical protein